MIQLTYISTATPAYHPVDVDAVLAASRRNNGRDAITGILVHDRRRFLQVLEGPETAVNRTFDRIRADPRHRAVVVLARRDLAAREFGDWAMASEAVADVEEGADLEAQVSALVANVANPSTRARLESFARVRKAA